MMKRPMIIPALFFILGIIIASLSGDFVDKHILVFAAWPILMIILSVLFYKKSKYFYACICLFFMLLGIFRYSGVFINERNDIRSYASSDDQVILYGTIIGYPELRESAFSKYRLFEFKSEKVLVGENEYTVRGNIYAKLFDLNKICAVGDKIVIGGTVFSPDKDDTDFLLLKSRKEDVYFKQGESGSLILKLKKILFSARSKAHIVLKNNLTGDSLAIIAPITLGLYGALGNDIKDLFIKTGTMHILSVSGLHVAALAAMLIFGFRLIKLPPRLTFLLVIILIWAFAILSGARAASLRSALMGTFMLISLMINMEYDITNSVILSAFFITFFSPEELFKPSFILSYTAILSIIFILPILNYLSGFTKHDKTAVIYKERILKLAAVKYIVKSFLMSFAVWIGMIPVISYYFGVVTPGALLANYIAIPFVFIAMIAGFIMIFIGGFADVSFLTYYLGIYTEKLARYYIKFMKVVSDIPFSNIEFKTVDLSFVLFYYFLLSGVIFYLSVRIKRAGKILSF